MFREMRRIRQQLPGEESEEILRRAKSGVLAVCGDDGYPYTVPVNHVYHDGKLSFHCAREGHKIDAIRRSDKVSFCVIAQDEVMAKKRTTAYVSVVAFGRAAIVEDAEEQRRLSRLLAEKFAPDYLEDCDRETESAIASGRMYCIEITVEHLTGKCGTQVLLKREREAAEGAG